MEVITTPECYKVTITRDELRQAISSEDNFMNFYTRIFETCIENERRIRTNENDKTQL